jgi:hypothetical protein
MKKLKNIANDQWQSLDDYYTFFMANLKIDFENKVLEYSETSI